MTKLIIVFAFFLSTICAVPLNFSTDDERIIGGTAAADGAYPYQISLRVGGSHYCGGSIISRSWILTAAHCVYGKHTSGMVVAVGTNQLNAGGQSYRVSQAISHRSYNPHTLRNDIAVLRVSGNIQFGNKVQAVALASSAPSPGTPLVLSGWGAISYPNQQTPNNLQQLNMNTVDISRCNSQYPQHPVDNTQVCAFSAPGQGACHGDSGGPLVASGTQVGVVSFGVPCAKGKPDVFSSVAAYRNWIRSNSGV